MSAKQSELVNDFTMTCHFELGLLGPNIASALCDALMQLSRHRNYCWHV